MVENLQRATKVRYLIVAVATLMSFVLYLDRFCVSFAVDYIRQDLSLTQSDIKWFLSIFFFSYALAQVPSGWLSDRYGARIMLVIYILTWSLFTGLIGASYSFLMLISTRLLCGLCQAGAYPTAAAVVKRWTPLTARGTASSFVANGGRIGGALAPIMTAYLIVLMVPADSPLEFQESDLFQPQLADEAARAKATNPYNSIAERLSRRSYSEKETAMEWVATRLNTQEKALVSRLGERERKRKLAIRLQQTIEAAGSGADFWKTARATPGFLGPSGKEIADAVASDTASRISALSPRPNEDEQEAVLGMLNRLLTDKELYDKQAMTSINLPREARTTLEKLSDKSSSSDVSDEEQVKFNRFVLEGVFNEELSKYYRRGWRPILYIYGGAGFFVAAIFWWVFRERPEDHPWSSEAEHSLVLSGQVSSRTTQAVGGAPVKALVTSGNLWLNCIGQWGTNVGWLFVFTWLPRYLMQMHQVPIIERGYMMMTPALVGMAGMFCGGRLSDVVASRLGIKWGRRLPVASSRLLAICAYLGAIALSMLPEDHGWNSPWVFTALFSVVAFSTDFGSAPNWAFMQDVGGKHVGSVLGWGNMWGNLGAFVAPHIYDYFLGETPGLTEWNMMFGICAISFAVSGLCWLKIDATKPVVPEPESSDTGDAESS